MRDKFSERCFEKLPTLGFIFELHKCIADKGLHKKPLRHPGAHILGTDILGNDVLYRTFKGIRVALLIGGFTSLIVIPIALVIFLLSRTGKASGFVRAGLVVCGLIMLVLIVPLVAGFLGDTVGVA